MTTASLTNTTDVYSFNEKKHIHLLNDKPLMGVTTVLGIIAKNALIQWAADQACEYIKGNCEVCDHNPKTADHFIVTEETLKEARLAHRKKKDSAGDWGTDIHAKVEAYIHLCMEAGKPLPYQDESIRDFVRWAVENNVKFLYSELGIYSKEWWVGGIVDFVCEIDGKIYVGDLKTSKSIYETYFFQTAAYGKMLVEMGLYPKVDGMIIVNLKKDGRFETQQRFNIDENIKCFEAALTLHKRLNV